MFLTPPSPAQLTATFRRVLAAIDGGMAAAPDCTGLDEATTDALNALAADRTHRAAKIMGARRAFAAQLDAMTVPADDTAFLAVLVDQLNHNGSVQTTADSTSAVVCVDRAGFVPLPPGGIQRSRWLTSQPTSTPCTSLMGTINPAQTDLIPFTGALSFYHGNLAGSHRRPARHS